MSQFDLGRRRVEFDPETTAPSVAVVEAIADVENVDSRGLVAGDGRKLQHYVDGDSLDRLLAEADGVATVTFTAHGYGVRVRSDGVVTVRPREPTADGPQHEQ